MQKSSMGCIDECFEVKNDILELPGKRMMNSIKITSILSMEVHSSLKLSRA